MFGGQGRSVTILSKGRRKSHYNCIETLIDLLYTGSSELYGQAASAAQHMDPPLISVYIINLHFLHNKNDLDN